MRPMRPWTPSWMVRRAWRGGARCWHTWRSALPAERSGPIGNCCGAPSARGATPWTRPRTSGSALALGSVRANAAVAGRDEPANIVCSIVADLSQEQLLQVARKAAQVRS
jgi:hypothetical protein